ncbi:MAG: SpoIIE family protein phosphatase [Defluviimonas sp.]|nr:SpoIIE family protein phosphatase [Defluviimonas sp.]
MTIAGPAVTVSPNAEGEEERAPADKPRVVLVVDDSRLQRKILVTQLAQSRFRVIEASSAEEALRLCESELPDIVISDWMMPGMSGPAFCGELRRRVTDRYVYFILLTSKSDALEVAEGLENGADDFVTKPVDGAELRGRLAAGERILGMERELTRKNALLTSTLGELRALYDSLDRDLAEARKLQESLVRDRHRDFGLAEVSLMLRPSGHVGGDLVGYFPIGSTHVGLYSIDVSGHGVTSALMTARIAGLLSGQSVEQNIALQRSAGAIVGVAPESVAAKLNRILLADLQTDAYLTLVYAELDLRSGQVRLVQAGHPHPFIRRADGRAEFIGTGGFPVGLFAEASYEGVEVRLNAGDRLLLMSDGISEAENPGGAQLGRDGVRDLAERIAPMRGPAALDAMVWHIDAYTDGQIADDLSCALVDFSGGG